MRIYTMNRDCGKGKLIPAKYTLAWCIGNSDDENKKTIDSPYSEEFEIILATLPPYSNIRMHVWDKKGYANCILSAYVNQDGITNYATNRLSEL